MQRERVIAQLSPNEPGSPMLEMCVLWVAVDCLVLIGFSRLSDLGAFPQARALTLLLMMKAQLAMAVLWLMLGVARWSDRILFLSLSFLLFAFGARGVLAFAIDTQPYPGVLHGAIMLDGATCALLTAVITLPFRLLGARLQGGDQPAPLGARRLSLADLFRLTTAAAIMAYVLTFKELAEHGMQLRGTGRLWQSSWVSIPATIATVVAALSNRPSNAYMYWVGAPIALVLFALGWRWWFMHVNFMNWMFLYIAAFPATLIASLEYLRLRGHRLQWKPWSGPECGR